MMRAIVGKKLGMTRVFDEDGTAVPVTVIEAAPNTITAIRKADRDGYDAVQLAGVPTEERKLTKAELGHLKKASAGPSRTVVEFRDAELPRRRRRWRGLRGRGGSEEGGGESPDSGDGERKVGDKVTVADFEAGEKVKIAAVSIGKGFQGTIKRHNFSRGPVTHGSHNVRAPGSAGASADPARIFPGQKMPGQMGSGPPHPARRHHPRRRRRAQPAAGQGLGSRRAQRDGGGAQRWLRPRPRPRRRSRPPRAAPRRRCSASRAKADLPEGPVLRAVPRVAGAPGGARRPERAPPRHALDPDPGRGGDDHAPRPGARRAPAAPASGALGVPHRYGGGVAFGPKPRHYTFKINRKARRRALRAALSVHADRGSVAVLDGSGFEKPSTKQAAQALQKWGADAPTLVVIGAEEEGAAKSFRNIPRVQVAQATAAGVADVIGAASLVVSEAALTELEGRTGLMDPRQVIIRPVVSEKSYALMADGKYTFRVHDRAHKTQIAQAVEEHLRGQGALGEDLQGPRQAQAPRPQLGHQPLLEEGGRPARPRPAHRAVRGRGGGGLEEI